MLVCRSLDVCSEMTCPKIRSDLRSAHELSYLYELLIPMTQSIHGDTRAEVDVASAVRVPHLRPLAVAEHELRAGVDREEVFFARG